MNQTPLFLILAAPAAAWVCGMGLFKTLLVLAFIDRYVPGGTLPGPLGVLGEQPFFWAVVAAGILEAVLDVIPGVDLKWDKWNAQLRIIGAAAVSYLLLASHAVPEAIMMGIIGAALAVVSFTAKAAARRAAWRGGTAGFVSPISSITENCLIAATLAPLASRGALAFMMLGFMTLAAMLVMYVIWKDANAMLRYLFTFRDTPITQVEIR